MRRLSKIWGRAKEKGTTPQTVHTNLRDHLAKTEKSGAYSNAWQLRGELIDSVLITLNLMAVLQIHSRG